MTNNNIIPTITADQLDAVRDKAHDGVIVKCPNRDVAAQLTKHLYETSAGQRYHIEHVPMTNDSADAITGVNVLIRGLHFSADFGWFSTDLSLDSGVDYRFEGDESKKLSEDPI